MLIFPQRKCRISCISGMLDRMHVYMQHVVGMCDNKDCVGIQKKIIQTRQDFYPENKAESISAIWNANNPFQDLNSVCHVHFQLWWPLRHRYLCMYVCMYGWIYGCMYVCMYVCMNTSKNSKQSSPKVSHLVINLQKMVKEYSNSQEHIICTSSLTLHLIDIVYSNYKLVL